MHRDRRGYVYQSVWENGGPARRYVGSGVAASLVLDLDALQSSGRAIERRRMREQREREREQLRREVIAPVLELDAQTRELVEALLSQIGIYRHNRGEYRRSKSNVMSNSIETANAAKLRTLAERANEGDREAARDFWHALDTGDDGEKRAQLIRQTGDIAAAALSHILARVSSGNPIIEGGTRRQLDEMRAELTGARYSPIEAKLIDRVLVCWLQLHYFEAQLFAGLDAATPEQSAQTQKLIDGANRRYLASLKALASVRKLGLPTIQINIAEKQINMAP